MSITYTCSVCGASTDVDDALAGQQVKCRECDSPVRVPPAPLVKPASPADKPTPRRDGPRRSTEKATPPVDVRHRPKDWMLVVSAVLHALVILVWAYCVWHTYGILQGWVFHDANANQVNLQIARGTYSLARMLAGWIGAYAITAILNVFQKLIDPRGLAGH